MSTAETVSTIECFRFIDLILPKIHRSYSYIRIRITKNSGAKLNFIYPEFTQASFQPKA
ncbi:hypothetical protein MIDIC_170015 [Alphaproteobacteria bacterium]